MAESVGQLTQERDASRTELEQTRGVVPDRIQEELAGRLGDITQAHQEELGRCRPTATGWGPASTELEQDLSASQTQAMSTVDLAEHFSGARPVQTAPALRRGVFRRSTGFTVQAKGLLRPNHRGEVEIVTAQAGAVSAEQLDRADGSQAPAAPACAAGRTAVMTEPVAGALRITDMAVEQAVAAAAAGEIGRAARSQRIDTGVLNGRLGEGCGCAKSSPRRPNRSPICRAARRGAAGGAPAGAGRSSGGCGVRRCARQHGRPRRHGRPDAHVQVRAALEINQGR